MQPNGKKLGDRIKDLVLRMVKSVTSHHQDIELALEAVQKMGFMRLRVNRADMPRVLGGGGANFRAIVSIVEAIGEKNRVPIKVQLLEPTKGQPGQLSRFVPDPKWPQAEITALLTDAATECFSGPVEVKAVHGEKDNTSVYTVALDASEPMARLESLREAFSAIFNSIGKASGRIIFVNIGEAATEDNPLNL